MQKFLTCDASDSAVKLRQELNHPRHWWFNPTNPKSLRLHSNSYHIVKKCFLPYWEFALTSSIRSRHLLYMEKYFTSPYYIYPVTMHRRILVWGETESIMIALHTNDLGKYLDNLAL